MIKSYRGQEQYICDYCESTIGSVFCPTVCPFYLPEETDPEGKLHFCNNYVCLVRYVQDKREEQVDLQVDIYREQLLESQLT